MPDPDIVLLGTVWPTSALKGLGAEVEDLNANCIRCGELVEFTKMHWFRPVAVRSPDCAARLDDQARDALFTPDTSMLSRASFDSVLSLPPTQEDASLGDDGFPVRLVIACGICVCESEFIGPADFSSGSIGDFVSALRAEKAGV